MNTVTMSPVVSESDVVFTVEDPAGNLSEVKLHQEIQRPRVGPSFTQTSEGTWRLRLARPDVDRMEYMLELAQEDGSSRLTSDPGNALTARGPFGDKSVVEWPDYRAPSWLEGDFDYPGSTVGASIDCGPLGTPLPVLLWSSHGADDGQPLPLLVAHDGPQYSEFSKLLMMLDRKTSEGVLPPMRAALIGPVERNEIYSASAVYGRTLAHHVLPWLSGHAPTPQGRRFRVGMGASLGGLAMLHVHRTYPASFGALFLQSGSFFRQRFDKHEWDFPRFRRISRFVGRVLTAEEWIHPVPVTMTCGVIEENLANNRAVHDALAAQSYDVRLATSRDGHNWVSWRDTFDPHLVDLLQRVWS